MNLHDSPHSQKQLLSQKAYELNWPEEKYMKAFGGCVSKTADRVIELHETLLVKYEKLQWIHLKLSPSYLCFVALFLLQNGVLDASIITSVPSSEKVAKMKVLGLEAKNYE